MINGVAFIVYGALRSGSTLLRLMINHHPELANAGEFDYIFDHIQRSPEGIRINRDALKVHFGFQNFGFVIDDSLSDDALLADLFSQITSRKSGIQSINIHRHLDHVLDFLPNAKVIKLNRDPRDVALSSIRMGWAGTTYHGISHWIETERAWDRAASRLAPGSTLELDYADLVKDPTYQLTRICQFAGVEFDRAMFSYPANSTYGPIDASSVSNWKNKISMAEAALATSRAPALIASRGYEVPGGTAAPGHIKKLHLAAKNKLGVWRHAINKYGIGTVLLEKGSRKLGLRDLNRKIVEHRINPVTIAHLK